jgi:DNA-binding Xre family transcriptional regulator
MLERRGRSLYWLAQATDTHYPGLWRLAEGNVTRVTLETLDRICDVLNCTPGDLLVKVERKSRKKGK